ncbi:hypothetical protein LJR189_004667 [Acidovorax delafieldii]|uniref:hypothetical protein n=1 Tax=Acidovorax delafieldii TaxID=47920 RepID=UPI003ED088EF
MNKFEFVFLLAAIYSGTSFAASDPSLEFKTIAERCKAAFNERPAVEVSMNQKNQAWVKRLFGPTVVTFDAKRTDSVIAPLSGYIEVSEVATFKSDPNEDIARSAELSISDTSTPALKFLTRINYKFDGTAWSVSDGFKSTAFRPVGASSFEKNSQALPYSAEKLKEIEGPISNCIKK